MNAVAASTSCLGHFHSLVFAMIFKVFRILTSLRLVPTSIEITTQSMINSVLGIYLTVMKTAGIIAVILVKIAAAGQVDI